MTRVEFKSFKTNASSITSYSVRTIPPGSAAERSANVSYSLTKAEQLKDKISKMSSAQMEVNAQSEGVMLALLENVEEHYPEELAALSSLL